jgi:hypothetical protein
MPRIQLTDREIARLDRENDDAFVVSLALNQIARQQAAEIPPLASITLIEVLTLRSVCATVGDVMWYLFDWSGPRVQRALAAGIDTGEIEMVELPGYDVPLFRASALSTAHAAPRGTPWSGARLSDDAEWFEFTIDGTPRALVIDGSTAAAREDRAWWEVGRMFDAERVALVDRSPFGLELLPLN